MDIETGRIYAISDDDELKQIEASLGRMLVPLTQAQADKLKPLSNRMRKRLLSGGPCICGSGKSFKKCCWKKYKKQQKKTDC